MKKIIGVIILLTYLFSLCGCELFDLTETKKTLKDTTAEHLNLSLENATVLDEWDTHGGFHGDGMTFVKLKCDDGFEEELISDWKSLPMDGEAYEYFYEWDGVFEHPETGERVIPETDNAYWYFKNTGPMNWEFALYDLDEDILYFYILDA